MATVKAVLQSGPAGALLLVIALGVMPLASLVAAPYPPGGLATQWQQPDGTLLQLRVFGDEFYARTETQDGYTVVFDAASKAYYYAQQSKAGSKLIAMQVAAHEPVPVDLPKHLKDAAATIKSIWEANVQTFAPDRAARWEARRNAVNSQRARAMRLSEGIALPPQPSELMAEQALLAAPITGSKVGLLILVQFPDDPATPAIDPTVFPTTQAKIERMSNEVGYTDDGNTGSIRDYFSDQSEGQLTHTQLVTAIVTMPNPRNFYNFSDYPSNNILANSGTTGRLLVETALNQLVVAGFDFSSVSVGAGNLVEATSLLFAGSDSGVWPEGLWPHAWALAAPVNVGSVVSPRFVWRYQVTNVATAAPVIGTIAHELGHLLLDYPDFYDTDASDGDSEGVGEHSLMGSGNHLNGGRTPAPIDIYLKDFSGWADISELGAGVVTVETLPSTGNIGYRLRHPSTTSEYFLVENRGPGDKWAQHSPDQGILIWHVDEAVTTDNQRQQMTPGQHYELSVEQADGSFDLEMNVNRGDSGDLFDGVGPVFADQTVPSANWWSGVASGFSAQVLSLPGASMDVRFHEVITLSQDEALDTLGTGLVWPNNGDWLATLSPSAHDTIDAAFSKPITHNQSTSIATTVEGPGVLSFWWKVDSEPGFDFLRFTVGGVEHSSAPAISGSVAWQQQTVAIPAGIQLLSWTYAKDGSIAGGTDVGWLDEVVYSGSEPDTDGDGLTDAEELVLGTDIHQLDTDGDGLTDGMGGVVSVLVYPSGIDSNSDGFVDGEADLGTDPTASNIGDLAPVGNLDSVINLGDLQVIHRIVNRSVVPTPMQSELGDLNSDGALDIADVLLLQKQLLLGADD